MNLLMKRLSANVTLPSMAVPCSSSAHAKVPYIPTGVFSSVVSSSTLSKAAISSTFYLFKRHAM